MKRFRRWHKKRQGRGRRTHGTHTTTALARTTTLTPPITLTRGTEHDRTVVAVITADVEKQARDKIEKAKVGADSEVGRLELIIAKPKNLTEPG